MFNFVVFANVDGTSNAGKKGAANGADAPLYFSWSFAAIIVVVVVVVVVAGTWL